jgi:glucose/mannose-6-phosphate isomerase
MEKTLLLKDINKLYTVLKNSWEQAENAWKPVNIPGIKNEKITKIIITGLGGSAISGDILKNFLRDELKIPVTINRSYSLPHYTDTNTLVIASSYSGNTEETISAFRSALELKCPVIAITTGGEIEKLAIVNNIPVIKLQEGFQPRYALYSSFFTLVRLMQDLKFIISQDEIVTRIINNIKIKGEEYIKNHNSAFRTASELKKYIPVIYSITDFNDSAGRRFKGQLNENSKIHAWVGEYPEMNHNELVGWESVKESGISYKPVLLWDNDIPSRIKKRIEIINNLLKGEDIDILTFSGNGNSFKERLIDIIYFSDWVSYYLALLNEKDPGEIDFIHQLKNRMAED